MLIAEAVGYYSKGIWGTHNYILQHDLLYVVVSLTIQS